MANKMPFVLELTTAAVLNSGASSNAVVVDSGPDYFVIEEVSFAVENTASGGSTAAGVNLPTVAGTKASDATTPTANLLEALVTIGTLNLSDKRVPLPAMAMPLGVDATRRTPFMVEPKTTFQADFLNRLPSGYNVTPSIFFKGYKVADPNEAT